MINKVEERILQELRKDGRISYSDLATKTGLNQVTVSKRLNALIEENIVLVRALPNPYALGLRAQALIAIKADPTKIDDIYTEFADDFNVNMFITIFGRYDILMTIYFTAWEDLLDFLNQRLKNIDGVIRFDPFFIKDRHKGYPPFFDDTFAHQKEFTPSEFDWNLIKELVRDGRATNTDLSKKFGVHKSTISRRIEFLVNNKIILISAVVDPEYLGFTSNAFIALEVKQQQIDPICKDLVKYNEIHMILTFNNGFGILVGIHTSDNKKLYKFIKQKLAHINGLNTMETFIRAEVKKRYYGYQRGLPF